MFTKENNPSTAKKAAAAKPSGSDAKPAVSVKGGNVKKNSKFEKAKTEDRKVDPNKPPPGTSVSSQKSTADTNDPDAAGGKKSSKGVDPHAPAAADTAPKQDASNPPDFQSRDENASGSDSGILGTNHMMPGGHAGHGQ